MLKHPAPRTLGPVDAPQAPSRLLFSVAWRKEGLREAGRERREGLREVGRDVKRHCERERERGEKD